MRVVSWNVNGLRSLGKKEDFNAKLLELDADIVCLQETKVTRDLLEECYAVLPDFTSYFAFSRRKSGYSGVATFCRNSATPSRAEEGLGGTFLKAESDDTEFLDDLDKEFTNDDLKDLDAEGRCVITFHAVEGGDSLAVINVYCPRADPEKVDRESYKLKFYKLLEARANNFLRRNVNVIILGDINTSHKEIDHCEPYEEFGDNPGRRWLDHFLIPYDDRDKNQTSAEDEDIYEDWQPRCLTFSRHQFVDSFRHFHPKRSEAFTCWNTKMNCRSTNFGTRIDYVIVNLKLTPFMIASDIHPDRVGSDHCPVSASFSFSLMASERPPPLCSKNFPEFTGRQKKLSDFLQSKVTSSSETDKKRQLLQPEPSDCKKPRKALQQAKLSSFFSRRTTVEATAQTSTEVDLKSFEAIGNYEQDLVTSRDSKSVNAWKNLLKGPPQPPLCKGHGEPSVLRTVKKKGQNSGKQFWCCSRGEGRSDDPMARCNFFQWLK